MTEPEQQGWYPDYTQAGTERWHDGQQWTQATRSAAAGGAHAGPPAGTPKKRHIGRNILLGIVGLIVLIIVISVATGGGKKNGTAQSPATTPANGAGSTAAKQASTTAHTTAAAPKPVAVLDVTGTGTKQTKKFTTPGDDWTLSYRYDCSNFGSQGNFQVYVYDTASGLPDVAVNELGAGKRDATEEHQGGTFYLEVNSECSWHIVVTG